MEARRLETKTPWRRCNSIFTKSGLRGLPCSRTVRQKQGVEIVNEPFAYLGKLVVEDVVITGRTNADA